MRKLFIISLFLVLPQVLFADYIDGQITNRSGNFAYINHTKVTTNSFVKNTDTLSTSFFSKLTVRFDDIQIKLNPFSTLTINTVAKKDNDFKAIFTQKAGSAEYSLDNSYSDKEIAVVTVDNIYITRSSNFIININKNISTVYVKNGIVWVYRKSQVILDLTADIHFSKKIGMPLAVLDDNKFFRVLPNSSTLQTTIPRGF